jgi:hypothetical protein
MSGVEDVETIGNETPAPGEYVSLCGLYAWDPRLNLTLLVSAMGTNVVIAYLNLSRLLFAVSLGLAVWSKVPSKFFAWFFLSPAWSAVIVFLGFSAGFGPTPVFSLGPSYSVPGRQVSGIGGRGPGAQWPELVGRRFADHSDHPV